MPRKKEITEEKTEVKQKQFKLSDSYGSLLMGLVVVLVVVGVAIFALRGDKKVKEDTSSIQDESKEEEITEGVETDETGQKIYIVKKGDDLWHIAANVYKDGYKWIEISKANKIANPNLIVVGQKLVVPDLEDKELEKKLEEETDETEPTIAPTKTPTPTKKPETPDESKGEQKKAEDTKKDKEEKITGDKYTVEKGDHLWGIAVRAYGDGYKWVNIAKANKLTNPDIIHPKNVFKLPR